MWKAYEKKVYDRRKIKKIKYDNIIWAMSSGWELKIQENGKTGKETKTKRERERHSEKNCFLTSPWVKLT